MSTSSTPESESRDALTTAGDPTVGPLDGALGVMPSQLTPFELDTQEAAGEPKRTPLPIRLLRSMGVDRAIAFTVLARGWSAIAGMVTVALIARLLTPAEQGFYFVISPLVNIQIIFELGFSFVILQTASHEGAHLEIGADGTVRGAESAHGRLASILQRALRWYSIAALLMLFVLLTAVRHFFAGPAVRWPEVHWLGPWVVAALAAAFTFQIDPVFSFLEGCGFVPYIARARLTQFLTGSVLSIGALLLHHGLYAPGMMLLGQVLAGAVAIFGKRRLLLGLLRHNPGVHHVPFRTEIWPLQWRMAVSWISGYLTLPLFTPILFHSPWGAIEAGRMGMTMGIAAKLSDVAIAWMNTKSAPFGRLIALHKYAELDRRFFKSLIQSAAIGTAAAASVWLLAQWMNYRGHYLATRLLSPLALALVLFGYVGNVVVTSLAIYLRAHKQEKFMVNSILGALYTAPAAFFAGRAYGGLGIACVYALGTLVIGLGYGTYTFQKYRRAWHG